MLKASLIASLFALSVFGAPVLQSLQARHGEDALVAYVSDAKNKRGENDALVAYVSDAKVKREPASYPVQAAGADASDVLGKREPNENDALVAYVSDAKVKREPAKYAAEAAAAESSDVLGKREYISIASSADKAAVLG